MIHTHFNHHTMTLPKEIQDAINIQAENYSDLQPEWGYMEELRTIGRKEGYTEGATHFAAQVHRSQQENERLRKALEEIIKPYQPWSIAVRIANSALTAQPEADIDNQQKS